MTLTQGPPRPDNREMSRLAALTGIAVIVAAMLLTPLVTLGSYSSVVHTTSELAGQGMPGAVWMRIGLAGYGLGTGAAVALRWPAHPLRDLALVVFGLGLVGSAIWASHPSDPALPFDASEDWWHSVFSGLVGTAFAAATALRLFGPDGRPTDLLSWIGLVASVVLPLWMFADPGPGIDGLLQRTMFAISFLWIAREFSAPASR